MIGSLPSDSTASSTSTRPRHGTARPSSSGAADQRAVHGDRAAVVAQQVEPADRAVEHRRGDRRRACAAGPAGRPGRRCRPGRAAGSPAAADPAPYGRRPGRRGVCWAAERTAGPAGARRRATGRPWPVATTSRSLLSGSGQVRPSGRGAPSKRAITASISVSELGGDRLHPGAAPGQRLRARSTGTRGRRSRGRLRGADAAAAAADARRRPRDGRAAALGQAQDHDVVHVRLRPAPSGVR